MLGLSSGTCFPRRHTCPTEASKNPKLTAQIPNAKDHAPKFAAISFTFVMSAPLIHPFDERMLAANYRDKCVVTHKKKPGHL
jgi:hypothetical protein